MRYIITSKMIMRINWRIFGKKNQFSPNWIEEYDTKRYGPITTFDGVDGFKEIERYWLDEPYSFVSILFNEERNEYQYHVVEPALTSFEKMLLEKIYEDLRDVLIIERIPKEEEKNKIITEKVVELLKDYRISLNPKSFHKILYYVCRNYIGYGTVSYTHLTLPTKA